LTENITATVGVPPTSTDTDADTVKFANDPGFATGNLVHVSATGGGLTVDTHYYIRNLGRGFYSFYSSTDQAVAGGATARSALTGKTPPSLGGPRGRDPDSDGLDDRFEALVGWTVDNGQRTYQVYSSPSRADSNFDAPKPGDSNGDGIEDRLQYDGSDKS